MKMVSMFVSLFVALNVCAAGHKELPKRRFELTVFDKENIHFVPDTYAGYSAGCGWSHSSGEQSYYFKEDSDSRLPAGCDSQFEGDRSL